MKWFKETGVIAFLDFLLADRAGMVTPENPNGEYPLHIVHAMQRARALRHELLNPLQDRRSESLAAKSLSELPRARREKARNEPPPGGIPG